MSREIPKSTKSLRKLAESRLAGGAAVDLEKLTPDEIRGFVHELEVHRIELELQNSQLVEAQLQAEESRERYRRLYESAPIGYVTLHSDGTIALANPRASELLHVERARLIGRRLREFVSAAHQDRWHFARRKLHTQREHLSLELTLSLADGTSVEAQFVGTGRSGGTVDLAIMDVTELRRTETLLRKAAAQASLAEQKERRSLAADLHDDAAQLLSLASMKLSALVDATHDERDGQLRSLAQLLAEARERITSLSFQLSPPLLHDVGLVAATRWLADDLERRYGLNVTVTGSDESSALDEPTRVTLFRAIRELLINVTRHAGIDRARVQVWCDERMASIAVEDAGIGFDPNVQSNGFGLLALRERVAQLGGSLDIGSAPGAKGSRIVASLPLNDSARGAS
jgi:PAS domain S-box-containing protein